MYWCAWWLPWQDAATIFEPNVCNWAYVSLSRDGVVVGSSSGGPVLVGGVRPSRAANNPFRMGDGTDLLLLYLYKSLCFFFLLYPRFGEKLRTSIRVVYFISESDTWIFSWRPYNSEYSACVQSWVHEVDTFIQLDILLQSWYEVLVFLYLIGTPKYAELGNWVHS